MELIKQNKQEPNCFALSVVMVLRHVLSQSDYITKDCLAHAERLYDYIDHKGQQVLWPMCSGSQRLKGIHPQEVIDWLLNDFGYVLWLFERFPRSAPHGLEEQAASLWSMDYCNERFWKSLEGNPAILIMSTHAVAWDGFRVFDCEEREWIPDLLNHQVVEAWRLARL